jgi:hypothetical protein
MSENMPCNPLTLRALEGCELVWTVLPVSTRALCLGVDGSLLVNTKTSLRNRSIHLDICRGFPYFPRSSSECRPDLVLFVDLGPSSLKAHYFLH